MAHKAAKKITKSSKSFKIMCLRFSEMYIRIPYLTSEYFIDIKIKKTCRLNVDHINRYITKG